MFPLLVKLLFGPSPRSAIATRSVSRTPSPLVSAKCLRLNVPLLRMLLLPPVNCTKPVMVPLLMTCGLPATARSDSAPMLPLLVRVAMPPVEFRITPADGRPGRPKGLEPTPVRRACQPPITDPPTDLTVTSPPPVALIAVLNCPVVDTLVALTCTGPVVELAQMPCAPAPCVEIAPCAATLMSPPARSGDYGAGVGEDAHCTDAARRDWPGGSHIDAAAAGSSSNADAVTARGRNARAGVVH